MILKLTKFIRIFYLKMIQILKIQLNFNRDSKNTFRYYTSIIGFFYHRGIGCKVNKIKAPEIFSKADDKNIISRDGDDGDDGGIKKVNEIILQYFLFFIPLQRDRKSQYKFNIKMG